MKFKPLSILCLLILILIPSVSSAVPIIVSQDNVVQDSTGCKPPIEYAIEHGCNLNRHSTYSINKYNCGNAIISSDCNGVVYQIAEIDYKSIMFVILIIFVFIVLVTFVVIKIM